MTVCLCVCAHEVCNVDGVCVCLLLSVHARMLFGV